MTDYMSENEIVTAAAELLPLLDEVIEHGREHQLKVVQVYVHGSSWRRLKRRLRRLVYRQWGQREVVEYEGYTFYNESGTEALGIIYVDDGHIMIATQHWQVRHLYVAQSPLEYVRVGLADNVVATRTEALRNIVETRYAIERLLPDGHPMKSRERPK